MSTNFEKGATFPGFIRHVCWKRVIHARLLRPIHLFWNTLPWLCLRPHCPSHYPPLKWVGGKRWLLPELEPLWDRDRRLVEPLCGGLAISIGLQPRRALLNDINSHVIYFYRWLKRGFQITLAMENDSDLYYSYRQRFNQLIRSGQADSSEAAALFYYLNRTGNNGLCRYNRKGEFNVPFGRHKRIKYRRDFGLYRHLLGGWNFATGPFDNLVLEPGDFVYADPPYGVEFRQYPKHGFAWKNQVKLAEWLAGHTGPVLLSNQATERIVDLYDNLGYILKFVKGPRRISCTGDRTPAREVLAMRNLSNMM
ncbi:MAG: Dam family site-specific DNA-(adenine-N6)-methyltransferase [Chloroflexi bacterium]|nr:Dam family site-specific DNA-(adenine-N6)-methyltransferase [Chloroflexota bacterium]